MKSRLALSNRLDRRGLTWVMVWAITLSFASASIQKRLPLEFLTEQTQFTLGIILGGLSATWTLMLTWVSIADLPTNTSNQYFPAWTSQRFESRIQLLLVWLVPTLAFSYVIRENPLILAQLFLTSFIAVAGPTVVMQWTRQRIQRVDSGETETRSIRQILGLATTVAILIAAVQWGRREFSIPSSVIGAMVANSIVWLVVLAVTLGRWRALYFLSFPVVVGLWIAVSLYVEYQDRNNELQTMRLDGMMVGFYFFSSLLLFLMRSSGHRWSPLRRHRVERDSES